METHAKIQAPLCSTGQEQHLSTSSNGQLSPGENKVATVSAGLFLNIIKKWQQARDM